MNLLVCFFLHPLLLIGAWLTFVALDGSDVAPLFVLLGSLALLTTIEGLAPAEPRWTQTAGEKLGLFAIYLAVIVLFSIVLAIYDTTLAHANLAADTPVLNWFVTGPAQHRRHHSSDFDTSNTNYSCNAILWDRLFGTYSAGPVAETGIGPREPTFWQKLALPVREPVYVDTVAHRRRD